MLGISESSPPKQSHCNAAQRDTWSREDCRQFLPLLEGLLTDCQIEQASAVGTGLRNHYIGDQ